MDLRRQQSTWRSTANSKRLPTIVKYSVRSEIPLIQSRCSSLQTATSLALLRLQESEHRAQEAELLAQQAVAERKQREE